MIPVRRGKRLRQGFSSRLPWFLKGEDLYRVDLCGDVNWPVGRGVCQRREEAATGLPTVCRRLARARDVGHWRQ